MYVLHTLETMWIPWPSNSLHIPYTETKDGVGHGENRLAYILGVNVQGQNMPYDFIYKGIEYDVKQLDYGTFNSGVKARDALRPFKMEINTLLILLSHITDICSDYIPNIINNIRDVIKCSPDEMCESSLKLLDSVCHDLHDIYSKIPQGFREFEISDPFGKKVIVRSDAYYSILKSYGYCENDMEDFDKTHLYVLLDHHPYIKQPDKMMRDLNSLTSIFTGFFFVDKEKGYYQMDTPSDKTEFQRITKGGLRCRVLPKDLYSPKVKEPTNAELKATCKELGIKVKAKSTNMELHTLIVNSQGAS